MQKPCIRAKELVGNAAWIPFAIAPVAQGHPGACMSGIVFLPFFFTILLMICCKEEGAL